MLPGSEPAEGVDVGGNAPAGGIVGCALAGASTAAPELIPAPIEGDDPTPRLAGAEEGVPVCPTRGALAPEGEAVVEDGELAGRAAAGVPPFRSDVEGAPVVGAAAVRVAGEGDVPTEPAPLEPPVPTAGAAATRGVPKPEADALAAALLPPKLGGADGAAAAAPDPAAGIVGRVEPAAGSKSDPPPNDDEGGGPFEG